MRNRSSSKSIIALCAMSFAVFLIASACDDAKDAQPDHQEIAAHGLSAVSELVGKKYILDVPSAQWTAPEGLGEEIVKVQPKYAFEVIDLDASALTFTALFGTVKDGGQDMCNQTYMVNGTLNDDNMTFVLGPSDMQTFFVGPQTAAMAVCHDFTVSGQIIDEGAALVVDAMAAQLDARDIYPLFYMASYTSGDALCADMSALDMRCAECTFDPETALCLDFTAEDFNVSDASDLTLTEIAAFDEHCR